MHFIVVCSTKYSSLLCMLLNGKNQSSYLFDDGFAGKSYLVT